MTVFFAFLIAVLITLLQMSLIYPLPFSDTGTVRYRTLPYMTYALILINGLVFIAWQAPDLYRAQTFGELQAYVDKVWLYGYRGSFMREGLSIGAFTTFTSMFMHADFWHLFGNMIYLWTFGRRVEDACGAWRYLLFYLAAGMVANIGAEVLNPAHADLPGIGASGAIAGIMGAYLLLFPNARVDCLWGIGTILRIPYAAIRGQQVFKWTVKLPAWILLVYFAVREFLPSFQVIQSGQDVGGVSHLAHMTGFLAAILILFFVRKDLFMRYFSGRSV